MVVSMVIVMIAVSLMHLLLSIDALIAVWIVVSLLLLILSFWIRVSVLLWIVFDNYYNVRNGVVVVVNMMRMRITNRMINDSLKRHRFPIES